MTRTGCSNKSDEVIIYKTGGVRGFVDIHGKVAIEARCNESSAFSEGLACAGIGEGEDEIIYGFIVKNGKMVVEPQFANAGSFSDGHAIAKDLDGKTVVIDKTESGFTG